MIKTDKFEIKLGSHSICNGYCAVVLAYSKSCIDELKSNISIGVFSEVCDVERKRKTLAVH
jgi:hypothetical protein